MQDFEAAARISSLNPGLLHRKPALLCGAGAGVPAVRIRARCPRRAPPIPLRVPRRRARPLFRDETRGYLSVTIAPRRFHRRRPIMWTAATLKAFAVRTTEPMLKSGPSSQFRRAGGCAGYRYPRRSIQASNTGISRRRCAGRLPRAVPDRSAPAWATHRPRALPRPLARPGRFHSP